MLMDSPESMATESGQDPSFDKKNPSRKRSKVSRACDACRRKKIRCDAEYSPTLQKVTKICTNCSKITETCSFSRVPLKRGPSKGYVRESGMKLDDSDSETLTRPRSKLFDTAGLAASHGHSHSMRLGTPPSPMSQSLAKPILHRLEFSSTPSAALPIILPPLLGAQPLTQPVKLSIPVNKGPTPASPMNSNVGYNGSKVIDAPDHRIQGPLWKVPYEMPSTNGSGGTSAPPGANNMDFNSRRSSVDSISSILTASSRSRLPSLQPLTSLNSEMYRRLDSEDSEYGRSGTSSPRNSISSLLSLNGRVSKLLNITQPVGYQPPMQSAPPPTTMKFAPLHPTNPPPQLPNGFFSVSRSAPNGHLPLQTQFLPQDDLHVPFPVGSLEQNIHLYYKHFHSSFPILPFDSSVIFKAIAEFNNLPAPHQVIPHLFNAALNNLMNYQFVPLKVLIGLLSRFLNIYPFRSNGLPMNDQALVLSFASLLIINYTILLRGEAYSLGLSLAFGAMNEFKVVETYKLQIRNGLNGLEADDIRLYLPKCYLLLHIIDVCSSLTYGTQLQTTKSLDVLYDELPLTFPETFDLLSVEPVFKIARILEIIAKTKADRFDNGSSKFSTIQLPPDILLANDFTARFGTLIKDKYDLYNFVTEVAEDLRTASDVNHEDEDTFEHFHDYQLKVSRLVKRLSQSILGFANYISSMSLQTTPSASPKSLALINPFLNVSCSQAFKLIKVCKTFMDSVVSHTKDSEVTARAARTNNDLSISYNLWVSNLNNNLNIIKHARNALSANSNGNGNPGFVETTDIWGLGECCMLALMSKLEIYNLSFSKPENSDVFRRDVSHFKVWMKEHMGATESWVVREDIEGWF